MKNIIDQIQYDIPTFLDYETKKNMILSNIDEFQNTTLDTNDKIRLENSLKDYIDQYKHKYLLKLKMKRRYYLRNRLLKMKTKILNGYYNIGDFAFNVYTHHLYVYTSIPARNENIFTIYDTNENYISEKENIYHILLYLYDLISNRNEFERLNERSNCLDHEKTYEKYKYIYKYVRYRVEYFGYD